MHPVFTLMDYLAGCQMPIQNAIGASSSSSTSSSKSALYQGSKSSGAHVRLRTLLMQGEIGDPKLQKEVAVAGIGDGVAVKASVVVAAAGTGVVVGVTGDGVAKAGTGGVGTGVVVGVTDDGVAKAGAGGITEILSAITAATLSSASA